MKIIPTPFGINDPILIDVPFKSISYIFCYILSQFLDVSINDFRLFRL